MNTPLTNRAAAEEELLVCIGPASWRYGCTPQPGQRGLLVRLPTAAVDVKTVLLREADFIGAAWESLRIGTEHRQSGVLSFYPLPGLRPSADVARLLPEPAGYLPVFALAEAPSGWRVFAQLRIGERDALFVRTGELPADDTVSAGLIGRVISVLDSHREQLNNHGYYYRKFWPEIEVEHKLTLPTTVDAYALAVTFRHLIGTGHYPGYLWEYGDDFQQWDFANTLFHIPGPPDEAGYVSFIPDATGTQIVKRKWFTTDTTRRREQKWRGVAIAPDGFAAHIRTTFGVEPTYAGAFRRTRFDVSCESARTGNVYALMIDRCRMTDIPGPDLCQMEIEYLHSRTLRDNAADAIDGELEYLVTATVAELAARDIPVVRDHRSKLTHLLELRDAASMEGHRS